MSLNRVPYQPLQQPQGSESAIEIGSSSDYDSEDEEKQNSQQPRTTVNARTNSIVPLEIFDRNYNSNIEDEEVGYTPNNKSPLEYLALFDENELKAIEDQYGMDRHQLDAFVRQYRWYFHARRIENYFAMGTDIAYTPFQLVTGSDGVQGIAQLVKSDAKVSNTVGLAVGAPMALMDLAFNLSAVSPSKEAIKTTLDYATSDPLREQIAEAFEKAREQPQEATLSALTWSFNKTVLYTHNIIGASANFLPFYEEIPFSLPIIGDVTIPAWMPLLPASAQFAIAGGFAYGGNRYYALFSNPDYLQNFSEFWMQGFKDLWNNKQDGKPWLIGEVFRGQVATPLQIALQGLLSTVAMRAYPNFYYIASATFEKFFELPATQAAGLAAAVSALVAWHTLCARYPRTYNRYMADHIKIEALLLRKFEETVERAIDQAVERQMNSVGAAVDSRTLDKRKLELKTRLQQDFIAANKKLLEDQILEENGKLYPFKKDRALIPQLSYRAAVGAYIGYHTVTPVLTSYVVNEPYSMTTLAMLATAGALGGALYFAERNRIRDHLILAQLEPETEQRQNTAPSNASNLSKGIADTITVSSNVSRALSTLGSAKRLVGDNHSVMGATAIIAVEQMINTILFTASKVRATVKDWACLQHARRNTARLFQPAVSGPLDDQLALLNERHSSQSRKPGQ